MIRRTLAAACTAALVIALAPSTPASAKDEPLPEFKSAQASPAKALSKGTVLELGTASGPETYIVQLDAPAVPTRSTASDRGDRMPQGATAYGKELKSEQADLTASIARVTGSTPKVLRSFTHAINGITVKLTRKQAQRVARIDGVKAVQVDFKRQLDTDNGPEWIGAPTIWDGSNVPGGVGSQGEGVIVGVLDTGLNPANASFADVGGDGYDHDLPAGWTGPVGVCDPENEDYIPDWGCNDKVIGYWDFDVANNDDGNYDDDGHGSHTASTAAGNQVDATAYAEGGEFSVNRTIKGVAPHANIIGYDVCDGAGCQGSSIVAAIEQAIVDGVDALNYSIGSSSPSNPWSDADAIGFLNARAAGIHVATSAGNDGPGAFTLGSPGDVPWMTTVGATTHDRKYVASVTDITATDASTLPDIPGSGLSGPTDGSYPLVYAGDAPYDNPTCETEYDETSGDPLWTPDLTGLIVVCDRGGNGRVEKGEIVAFNGAEGMILANDEASGDSLNGDAHALPAAHITYADGVVLKDYMEAHPGAEAALSGSQIDIDPANGDIMAAFSSRGPNRSVSSISPSVSAPGVDILAAAGTDNAEEWHFISGTSMASPHTAGALALLKGVQPEWSPAEAQSALMTTSERDITDSDGTDADWFDMGSGRVELRRAAKAGLVLDEDLTGYQGADPSAGGDVRALNTASMADDECLQSCEWTRTFTGTSTGVGSWTVSVENLSDGLTLDADVDTIALTDGGTADVTVTAEIASGTPTDTWLFGTLVLTPPDGSDAPVAHLPVGVLPSAGVLPSEIDITTRRDAGSQVSTDLEAIEITDLQIDASGLVPEQSKQISVVEDSTNTNPFDGNGVHVEQIEVPEGAASLLASLGNPTAPDFDLFVGTGEVSEANVACASATGGSDEHCEIAEPEAGTWWVLVQNWEASTAGGSDTTDLRTAVVAGDKGNLWAEGPEGALPAATPFDIRTFWDEPELDAGETWHGALTLSTAPGADGDIGVVPVTVHRIEDDVTKTADKETAAPGETITYTVEVAPNVTPEDLTYTIEDTLPEGTTYVDGSATDGATFEDGVVSWSGELVSTFGDEGSYTITTSADDDSCVTPFGPGYVDLYAVSNGAITPQATIGVDEETGDTVTYSAFTSTQFGFSGQNYSGLEFSDDGFLVYGSGYAGEPWTPQDVPDTAAPNNLAAMLWQDMQFRYDAASNSGVSLATAGGGTVAVVEYDNMRMYGDDAGAAGSLDMEVFAVAGSNDLVFAYDNIDAGPILGSDPGAPVTIGTENAEGTVGAALVNAGDATTVLEDGLNVCARYSEPEAPTASFSYQVTVDEDVHERQELVNKAVHTTNDPGAKPETASAMVKVAGSLERSEVALAVSPDQIGTNGTTTATATVFSAGESTPTGQVEFWVGDRLAGTSDLDADGKATATLGGFDTAGTFPVTAKYLGDAATRPSTSAPVNVVVTKPGTPPVEPVDSTTGLSVDPSQFGVGGTPTATATVTSTGDATPTGDVQFLVGDRLAGTAPVGADGKATATLTGFTTAGTFPVTAKYLGDAATRPSTSTPVNVVVTGPKVDPSIMIVTDRNVREGTRPKVKIIVTAPDVTPTGTVEVKVRGAVERNKTYTVTLDSFGVAKLRLPEADLKKRQKKGKIKVKVSYSGDAAVLPDKERVTIRVRR
ncbi:DUF11 domain-containing protein [Nocardioides seonyuensis]|uniref:DUF11 domain-containing protein n=1 Tax=Nocardioides seonyuensis TaxID=2518371 RepID=A0A4P7IH44_9ACTN|nr:S8 family serine peptidase [Nocardioides seonyuensis]QBX55437.1 DUF11 domain-containing protein [Nocardioides seonyuensis]